jgi:hypothetical protein
LEEKNNEQMLDDEMPDKHFSATDTHCQPSTTTTTNNNKNRQKLPTLAATRWPSRIFVTDSVNKAKNRNTTT